MGYMRHHTIVVSGWKREYVERAREEAVKIFATAGQIETSHDTVLTTSLEPTDQDRGHLAPLVSDVVDGKTNGYASFAAFFVAPDGGKEWWDTSEAANRARDRFIEWLDSDAAPVLDWAEVQYGDDEGRQLVTRASNNNQELSDQ